MDITTAQVQEAARQLRLIVDRPAIATQDLTKGTRFARKELTSNLPDGYVAIIDNRNKTTYTRMPLETFKTLLTIYGDQFRKGDAPKLLKKIMVNRQLFTSNAKFLDIVQGQGESIPFFEAKPRQKVKKKVTLKGKQKKLGVKAKPPETKPVIVPIEGNEDFFTIDGVFYGYDEEDNEVLNDDLEPVGISITSMRPMTVNDIEWYNSGLEDKHYRNPNYKGSGKKSVMKVEPVVFPNLLPQPTLQAEARKPQPKYTRYPQLPPEYYWGQELSGGGYTGTPSPVEGSEVIYKKSDNKRLDSIDVMWSTDDKVLYDENLDEIEYASIGKRIRDAEFFNKSLR